MQQVLLQNGFLAGQLLLGHLLHREQEECVYMLCVSLLRWCERIAAHLDVIGPTVLLPLPFDPTLDQIKSFLPSGTRSLHLHRRVLNALL